MDLYVDTHMDDRRPGPARFRPARDEDWEPFKDDIIRLYWDEDNKLSVVMEAMKQRHGFHASEKQYKRLFDKWKLEKNVTSEKMHAISRIQDRRREHENKETEFNLRGRQVAQEKIDRWRKRQKADHDEVVSPSLSIAASTPSGIDYWTPASLASSPPSYHVPGLEQASSSPHYDGSNVSSPRESSFATPAAQLEPAISGPGPAPPYLFDGYHSLQPPYSSSTDLASSYVCPSDFNQGQQILCGGHSTLPLAHGGHNQDLWLQSTYGTQGAFMANENAPAHGYLGSPVLPPNPLTAPQHPGHGAPHDHRFQYSQCTGRRRALLVGINYVGQRGELRNCISDVRNMSAYLAGYFGYKRTDMVILTDDQANPLSMPTRQNMLRAMHWLVKDAQPNDSLFFHYSGHGGQVNDMDDDDCDEVIFPVDFRETGHIRDDEMHSIMIEPLQAGVRLTTIFDSCHAGSALDLPYIYPIGGILKGLHSAKAAGPELLSLASSPSSPGILGIKGSVNGFFGKIPSGGPGRDRAVAATTSPADVIMLCGRNHGNARKATGGISRAFIKAMKRNGQQSYDQLLSSIYDDLATGCAQRPVLSCNHPLNTNLLFVM